MSLHEIVLPETKPETEWVAGRALQKMSPTYTHARLQEYWCAALRTWIDVLDCGWVAVEWRFRVAPPGKPIRPLVPDIAYISDERLPRDVSAGESDTPLAPPTVAIEILSPGDRPRDVADKVGTYLSAGTTAVVTVDPVLRGVLMHTAEGTTSFIDGDTFTSPALPGFSLDVRAMFDAPKRRRADGV